MGRGFGIGQAVEPPFEIEEDRVYVRWPNGRCFEFAEQLPPTDKPESN